MTTKVKTILDPGQRFAQAYGNAYRKGFAAGCHHTPTPMAVTWPNGTLVQIIPAGPCGFAWVTVRPGNSSFARWLTHHSIARKAYRGGVEIWIKEFEQSVERKQVMARVMAEHLTATLGIEGISHGSRLD
jgi:hypothetical protein